jgi:hypothetical protein
MNPQSAEEVSLQNKVRRSHRGHLHSLAEIATDRRHVRSTSESGHVQCTRRCPLSANSGHLGIQFDYAISQVSVTGPGSS